MSSFTIPFKEALQHDPTLESDVLSNYPIFAEDYREWLNQQIKDQFWNREIGMESVSMFKLALRRKLNQVMPYYNEQYKTSLIAAGVDPLTTIGIENNSENTGKSTSNADSATDSESDSKSRATSSDFPQTALSGNGDYASAGNDSVSKTQSKSTAGEKSTAEQSGNNKATIKGFNGQVSVLLMQHRQTLVNVDVMLLNDLDDLFFGLWSTGDNYSGNTTTGITGYGTGIFGHGIYGY